MKKKGLEEQIANRSPCESIGLRSKRKEGRNEEKGGKGGRKEGRL